MRNEAPRNSYFDWNVERFSLSNMSLYILSQVPVRNLKYKTKCVLWILSSLDESVNVTKFQAIEVYSSLD
jgi:hypothetical protein